MDHVSREKRSWLMSRVSAKNTQPEIVVRKMLHGLGYRFRIHYKMLIGKPDIVFTKRKKIIFIHGCFWHGHEGCKYAKLPASRTEFWADKMARNRERDTRVRLELNNQGWQTLTIWQCDLKREHGLADKLKKYLGPPKMG